ncbi:MAG: IclR family transcriptional regulator [Terriglobales bacterium]
MNTADKLLSVLRLYTLDQPEWTVEEAAKEIGISISTAYRYFRSLCKIGLLEPLNGSVYTLGPAIVEYDRQIRINDPIIKIGKPIMQRLIAHSGIAGTALLCRMHRNCVMCIHQEGESSQKHPLGYERGRLMPLFLGSASKAIFANLPWATVRSLFREFPREIAQAGLGSDWLTLRANLRRIRKDGVVVARGEVDRDRVGISAPVFGPKKNVLGSISLVFWASEASPDTIYNVSALVDAAGRQIHAGLVNLASGRNLLQPVPFGGPTSLEVQPSIMASAKEKA